MAFRIAIPNGFDAKRSSMSYVVRAQVNDGSGAAAPTELPRIGGRISQVIQRSTGEGEVKILADLDYHLWRSDPVQGPARYQLPPIDVPTLVEEGKFSFGYKWTYSFSAGNLVFGPPERLSNPWNRGFNILQGLCEDVKDKDQVARPWVYALPLLKFKSAPGPYSGWSYQMPVWGGPSYTPEGAAPTPDGGYQLGKFWIDLEITSPEAKIDLDPKDLQLLLLFAHDRPKVGDKITDEMVLKLRTWVKAIKASNLLPVLQNRYLKIHVWGHADKSGNISGKTPAYNQDLSTRRRKMVQTYLETQWDANVEFVFKDEADEKATPGAPHAKWDRNAAVFIDQSEAEAALGRYYREGNTP